MATQVDGLGQVIKLDVLFCERGTRHGGEKNIEQPKIVLGPSGNSRPLFQ